MQRQLTRRISELLMDMDGATQAASSVAVNGRNVPMSYGQGDHHVRLSYVTPAEQMLLADVDMYNSDPPHRGPAGIPNFNDGGGGVGGDDGDGGGVGGDAVGDDTGIGPDSPSVGGDIGAPTGGVTGTVGPSQAETEAAGMPTTAGEALGISTDPGFGQLGVPDTLFGSGGSETLRGGESLIQDLGKETTISQINQDVRAARSQGTSFPELAAAFGNLSNEAVASLLAQQSRGDAPQLSPSLFGTGNEAVGDALNAIGVGVKGFGGTGGAGAAITDPGLSTTASNIQAATAQNPQLGFLTPPASQTGFLSSAASGLVNLLRNKGGPVPENAPRGHFPAYITPNEAGFLRSQGGGVSPGGGQYMVGGIPAFFSPSDPNGGDDGGGGGVGGDGIGDDTGIGPDTGPSGEVSGGEGSVTLEGGSGFDTFGLQGVPQTEDPISGAFGSSDPVGEVAEDEEGDDDTPVDPISGRGLGLTVAPTTPGLLDFGINTGFESFDAPEGDDEGGVVTASGDSVTDDTATTDDESEDVDQGTVDAGIID